MKIEKWLLLFTENSSTFTLLYRLYRQLQSDGENFTFARVCRFKCETLETLYLSENH